MITNRKLLFVNVLLISNSYFVFSQAVSEAFIENEIVPDVIDVAPESLVEVYYSIVVNLGNELTPTEVQNEPWVNFFAYPDSYYALLKVDPDAPSREDPAYREVCHWVVVNIPGNNITEGEVIYSYMGARPPRGSGFHRYVFLVFEQNGLQQFDESGAGGDSDENRLNFDARDFAARHELGDPVAGNFYVAQWDESVG